MFCQSTLSRKVTLLLLAAALTACDSASINQFATTAGYESTVNPESTTVSVQEPVTVLGSGQIETQEPGLANDVANDGLANDDLASTEQPVNNQVDNDQQINDALVVDSESTSARDFCPEYETSPLYRPRSNVLLIGPGESDWELKIENARADTEILLLDGEYLLDFESIFMDKPDITIRSLSGNQDAVVIKGLGFDIGTSEGFMIAADRITIADISMHGMRRHAIAMKPGLDNDAILDKTYIYNVNLYDIGTQQIKGADSGENLSLIHISEPTRPY